MAKKILVVVDVQNDFVYGSLGSNEAVAVVPNIVKKVNEYRNNGDLIIFTQDTHYDNYLDTQEGKKLPVEHCIRGTSGWEIVDEINYKKFEKFNNFAVYRKSTFGFDDWDWEERFNNTDDSLLDIEIIGLCTDICVITNALLIKTYYPEAKITVDASCCAGTTPDKHTAALNVMKSCQINVIGESDE